MQPFRQQEGGNQLNIICAAEVVVALACRTDTLVLLRGYPRPVPMLIAYDNEQVLAMVSSSSTGGQRQLARSRGIGRDQSGVLDDSKKTKSSLPSSSSYNRQSTKIVSDTPPALPNEHTKVRASQRTSMRPAITQMYPSKQGTTSGMREMGLIVSDVSLV